MLRVPDVTDVDIAFGNIKHMPKYDTLPADFKRHNGNDYCKAISAWFFRGAKAHANGIQIDGVTFTAKPGVDPKKALAAIKSIMGSWDPKHEHKEAGCGFLLAEWFDIEKSKAA